MKGAICPCGGENTRCFRCDGTGFYEQDPQTPKNFEQPFRSAGPHTPTPPTSWVWSPNSGRKPKSSASEVKTVICPTCGDKLKGFQGLDRHVAAKHPLPVRPPKVPAKALIRISPKADLASQVAKPTHPKSREACPVCGKVLKSSEGVRRHTEVKHPTPVEAAARVPSKSRKLSAASATRLPARGIHLQQVSIDRGYTVTREVKERTLDGSRDYYDRFHEGSRLGSHPSHDDYGDESFS